jgi:uncharacterized protein
MKYFTLFLIGSSLVLFNSCAPSNKVVSIKETTGNNERKSATTPLIATPFAANTHLQSTATTAQSSVVTNTTASEKTKTISITTQLSSDNVSDQTIRNDTVLTSLTNKNITEMRLPALTHADSLQIAESFGKEYQYGRHLDMNVIKAKTYYQKAINDKSALAMNNRGSLYLKEPGSYRNIEAAFNLFKQAADLNYAPSIVNLAHMYHKGQYVTQDFTKAFQLYKQAADLNNKNGIYWTGYMYYKGLGTVQDYSKAIEYFRKDSVRGEGRAIYLLGYCNLKAYGMNQNLDKAKECFTVAFKKGEEQAKYLALHHTVDSIKRHPNPAISSIADIQNNRLIAGRMPANENSHDTDSLQGTWTGKLYVYDWSRTVIENEEDMTLNLQVEADKLSGTWSLNGKQVMQFVASSSNGLWYVKQSSVDSDKNVTFKLNTLSCRMNTGHNHNLYITGNLERISKEANEPMRPSCFILDKKTATPDTTFIINRIYPNPMDHQLHIDFTVRKTDKITFQIQNQNGIANFSTKPKTYQAGSYSLIIHPALTTGIYNVIALGSQYKLTQTIIRK